MAFESPFLNILLLGVSLIYFECITFTQDYTKNFSNKVIMCYKRKNLNPTHFHGRIQRRCKELAEREKGGNDFKHIL